MLLGAQLSVAGGVHRALELAEGYGFNVLALFVRPHRQWRSVALTPQAVRLFRAQRRRLGIVSVVAHGSYLANLAAPGRAGEKARLITAEELHRCGRLGIDYLNIHPGSAADEAAGIERLAAALNEVVAACPHRRVKVLLETTAGQGNSLGWNFEQLAWMLSLLRPARRFGVCLDTCHVFAAGYDIRARRAYEATMRSFDDVIGLGRLKAIHLNDSKRPLGSRVDRHEHIGRGLIGLEGLEHFVNDGRLAAVPMILETPKGTTADGEDWDAVNARVVRSLRKGSRRTSA